LGRLLAAPWVQLFFSAGNGWPHNALRHHWLMPISCHFGDCKALLVTSLTRVSGAIASVQTFTFTFQDIESTSSATYRRTDGRTKERTAITLCLRPVQSYWPTHEKVDLRFNSGGLIIISWSFSSLISIQLRYLAISSSSLTGDLLHK